MTEGKRQKQVANEIAKELNDLFLKMSLTMVDGGMVSIASVKMTPDLYEARIYLSLFQVKDPQAVLEKFKELSSEIRGELGKRMRHQLRIIPQLTFYLDDTLDYVFKIEKLLDDIKKQDPHQDSGKDGQP
ncbi:30S ribosome-binding factor RbfA [Hanamia caeni]|jgi:ribosome-binding factor A|uniref:Ribosome-binding factor A n=1 Tax=Hanamia caeni TaxID=2294116 RepID=A0A3M9NA14_9BACT|nr:30S ribosome-binding factor RbfA [Hanamia caeni]RNI34624.1 30S ribosome-binding factor RbfA [Hanamia caeni]